MSEGNWQAKDKALAWDVVTKTWTLDYEGVPPDEATPRTLVLKEGQP